MSISLFSQPFAHAESVDSSGNSGVISIPQNPTTTQFTTYCSNMLTYMNTCIQGPDVITYCQTGGMYCQDNHAPYLLNDVEVQCNATIVNLCPERYYCPDPYTMIGCPKGHFCREGASTIKPILNFFKWSKQILPTWLIGKAAIYFPELFALVAKNALHIIIIISYHSALKLQTPIQPTRCIYIEVTRLFYAIFELIWRSC